MSTFIVNKNGLDSVTLEMCTTARSEASVNLREALLDEAKDYVFCVDSLNVPLDSVPINKTLNKELFRVVRRNALQTLDKDSNSDIGEELVVYTVTQKFFDVASFVRSLNNWARGLENAYTLQGLADFRTLGGDPGAGSALQSNDAPFQFLRFLPARTQAQINGTLDVPALGRYDFIRFKLAVDGTLVLVLSHDFTNNFVLKFSKEGAAVMGLGNKISQIQRHLITGPDDALVIAEEATPSYYLAVTQHADGSPDFSDAWVANTLLGANIIQPGGNTREVTIYSQHSLYQVCDQRLKVSLSSHLPMLNNLLVRNGKETVDRMIVEVFFDNKVTTSVQFDDQGEFSGQSITNTLYAGQYPFVRKSDVGKQWHKLLTTFDLRFFRFHVYITYRSYDSQTDTWEIKTTLLPIPDGKYWDFSLRFLSEV